MKKIFVIFRQEFYVNLVHVTPAVKFLILLTIFKTRNYKVQNLQTAAGEPVGKSMPGCVKSLNYCYAPNQVIITREIL